MALEWLESAVSTVDVSWNEFEATLQIDQDKELLTVDIELINKEGYAGYFDELFLEKNLSNDKLFASEHTYIPIEKIEANKPFERVVFGALDVTQIARISYIPEAPMIGNDTNYIQMQIVHCQTNNIIATRTFIKDVNMEANKVFGFGPVNKEKALIDIDDGVKLVIETHGSGMELPRGIIIVQWDIA